MIKLKQKIVILDRDGVINHESAEYVKSAEEWHPIPGSLEAIAALSARGWQVVIATNQSGIGRGYYDEDALNAMHQKMHDLLAPLGGQVQEVYYCPHHPEAGCHCRKPKVGLVKQISEDFGLPFPFSEPLPFVGDSYRDLEAAYHSGCIPVLVLTGNGNKTLKKLEQENNDMLPFVKVYPDLFAAVQDMDVFHP